MINFKDANKYMASTYSYEIFNRVTLYVAWADYKYKKRFGNVVIPTLIAAYAGPFDGFKKDPFEEQAIKELLILSDWGWNKDLYEVFKQWSVRHCKSTEDMFDFHKTVNSTVAKSDKIYKLLEENSAKKIPMELYFPELTPSGYLQKNNWPRV